LREAIHVLEALGLVRGAPWGWTYVSKNPSALSPRVLKQLLERDDALLFDMIETRKEFEARNAELAAKHATEEHVRRLFQILDEMEADIRAVARSLSTNSISLDHCRGIPQSDPILHHDIHAVGACRDAPRGPGGKWSGGTHASWRIFCTSIGLSLFVLKREIPRKPERQCTRIWKCPMPITQH